MNGKRIHLMGVDGMWKHNRGFLKGILVGLPVNWNRRSLPD
jgi:hypothetical protein